MKQFREYKNPYSLADIFNAGSKYSTPFYTVEDIDFDGMVDARNKQVDAREKNAVMEAERGALRDSGSLDDAYNAIESIRRDYGDLEGVEKIAEARRERQKQTDEDEFRERLKDAAKGGVGADYEKTLANLYAEYGDPKSALSLTPKPPKQQSVKKEKQYAYYLEDPTDPESEGVPVEIGSKDHHKAIANGRRLMDLPALYDEREKVRKAVYNEEETGGWLEKLGNMLNIVEDEQAESPGRTRRVIEIRRRRPPMAPGTTTPVG